MQIYTHREIHAKPFPRVFDNMDFDDFLDMFVEDFWENFPIPGIMEKISVGSVNQVIRFGAIPWWMPKRFILWYISDMLSDHGFQGEIYFVTGKTVMR